MVSKVVGRLLKYQIEKYFEDNSLILSSNHGGRTSHSTLTALAKVQDANYKAIELGKKSAVISTDLSAAFDLVDHQLLCDKLNFYSVDAHSCSLIWNYLSNRHNITTIQGFESSVADANDCGTIQGGVMSGFLCNINSNEATALNRIMQDQPLYRSITLCDLGVNNVANSGISHVDDVNYTIYGESVALLESYIKSFLLLLITFY